MTERERKEDRFAPIDTFVRRHVGPNPEEVGQMLAEVGADSLAALMDQVVPGAIRMEGEMDLSPSRTESGLLAELEEIASKNQVFRSLIGMGYADCITPAVIQRNILENPGWYTQYTPYQAEISQGRMEALVNFQTMVSDLTDLPLSNASLLDEATAAAEAMHMCYAIHRKKRSAFFVDQACHPQTIAVIQTRAEPMGITLHIDDPATFAFADKDLCGILLQYPATDGRIWDVGEVVKSAKDAGAMIVMAAELMALPLLKSPGEWGADIAVGSTQRFGVPLGFGGPHAAYLSTKMEHRRMVPGRLIGVSKDVHGNIGYRLALQTREQHIRRDRATSNICTSQVLLAVIAGMYAVYHGPDGIKAIAQRIHDMTFALGEGLQALGYELRHDVFFDTLRVAATSEQAETLRQRALAAQVNLRYFDGGDIGLTLDETCNGDTLDAVLGIFAAEQEAPSCQSLGQDVPAYEAPFARTTDFLTHEIFQHYHCEHEMLRYIHRLQGKDLSLTHSMIPLGSCTMKLNATTEMVPITWPTFGALHPFAPKEQWQGYQHLFTQLETWLAEMTGFAGTSLQPNAGSQGEYTGLLTIRAYHHHRGDTERDVCLIPVSAHGTNPASAVMAGMKVVPVVCNDRGDIDLNDLRAKAEEHKEKLSALMITYPSTHGVFEEKVKEACDIIHQNGGQVYMDGANMNAQLGLTSPGEIGADVCHLNLHKTYCLSEGTPVAMAQGLNRPIEQLLESQRVLAWSEEKQGVRGASLEHVFATGTKPCVQVTLEDGRTFVCTDDHRVLTTEGWCEAGALKHSQHRVVVGPELPCDNPVDDAEAEARFEVTFGDIALSMKTMPEREKTLAFFRLLGLILSDGTYSQEAESGRRHIRVYPGTRFDAKKVVDDIEVVCGVRPTISRSNSIFSVRLPISFLRAFEAMPGIPEPGKRGDTEQTLPDILNEPSTPDAILREFLGGLFGGDGSSPLIVHLDKNPNTIKEVRFSQSRSSKAAVDALIQEVCELLARLGVEAYPHRTHRPKPSGESSDVQNNQLWRGELSVVWGSAFAERIGFRYCSHKTARLTAATAWWRMRETILKQKKTVAKRVLQRVASSKKGHQGPKPVWRPALEQVYNAYAQEEHVLNPYYVGFKGFNQLMKSHFANAIHGQMGRRSDLRGLRRTHRRAVLPAVGRGGDDTGMPTLEQFLTEIGARDWFNSHTKGGVGYAVTYAAGQEEEVLPTIKLKVVDIRSVGERNVYDLTVAKDHSFLANGVVVHNCIPHGGGGPGMGPICVADHLAPFLPGHPVHPVGGEEAIGPVSAAPYGSPSILPISWVYIALMGGDGLKYATEVAILNANYMASRLKDHYDILYTGPNGRVAHEFVIDIRPFKADTGVEVVDVAKRLMDFGFHSPTMSWPVPGTLMIEPTESESKAELDRFCDAMIAIRQEIQAIADGKLDRENNPLKNAPHPFERFASDEWPYAYSRQQAAFPAPWVRDRKFWPSVARIDDAYGDRNLMCSCPPMDSY